jgi:hypothetical protein
MAGEPGLRVDAFGVDAFGSPAGRRCVRLPVCPLVSFKFQARKLHFPWSPFGPSIETLPFVCGRIFAVHGEHVALYLVRLFSAAPVRNCTSEPGI